MDFSKKALGVADPEVGLNQTTSYTESDHPSVVTERNAQETIEPPVYASDEDVRLYFQHLKRMLGNGV